MIAMVLAAICGFLNVSQRPAPRPVSGDYVEARTCSVFAGACHYNGELVTTGRDAVMAWKINCGTWDGVDLSGVTAMAAVSCDENLSDTTAARKSEILIDSSATSAQAQAVSRLLKERCGAALGQVTTILRGPITFQLGSEQYEVNAPGFAAMTVAGLPNHECCKQPNLVWYSPLSPINGRMVGYTLNAQYTAGRIGDSWQRSDENSAFYGAFAF